MEYIYDAFISYRHVPKDQAVAKELQKRLESLKKKDGSKLRIFLDNTELSSAPSLPIELQKALEQSRYLIVICSPDYKDPKEEDKKKRDYCKDELNYFLQLHGNNDNIRTVWVDGEPDEAFPEALRYREETGLDQNGSPVKVRVEMDPLAADVRGDNPLKKLKVEYLRIAAPLLDVEFDQLYQRDHRRKLARLYAGIAVLTVFLVCMGFMYLQIKAKQRELYKNESIRLANDAMLHMEDDLSLAMLLANAALPEDMQKPEYPVTQEADTSIRTAALQHMYAEAAAPLTPKARVTFRNKRWGFGVFCGNGNYFTIIDSVQTWLYEAHTGMLIGAFPSQEVFFFEDGERCVYESGITFENEERWYIYSVCDVRTGKELWQVEIPALPEMHSMLEYERDTGRLWVVYTTYSDALGPPPADKVYWDAAYGWFDQEGVFHEDHTVPEARGSFVTVFYHSKGDLYADSNLLAGLDYEYKVAWDGLPEEYRQVADAVEDELNAAYYWEPYDAYTITKYMDGALYIVGCNIYSEDSLYAVWSAEAERVIWSDENACYLDSDTGLLYCINDYEIQIYETNPENFGLSQTEYPIGFISDNGKYWFDTFYSSWGDEEGYSLVAYDMSKLKDAVYGEKEPMTSDTLEKGDYQYACRLYSYDSYDVTNDGSRMVILEGDSRISFVDMVNGKMLFRANTEDQNILDIAFNEDGTLFAYAVSAEDAVDIFLLDVDAWECVGWKRIEQPDAWYPIYLEIRNDFLLALASNRTELWIYHLEDLDREPQHIQLREDCAVSYLSLSRTMLTADGLLIIPQSGSSFYDDTLVTASKIFDTETWEEIGFYSIDCDDEQDYYYDAAGGYLIQQYVDDFYVQRRGASGDFEVVYTIASDHDNMTLHGGSCICDGTWLVLQNEAYCEIYRLEDGALCYSLRKLDGRDCQIGVIDGQIYDLCMCWNRVSIPLLDTAEAREYVCDVLSLDGSRRILSDQQMEDYYVPSHWREK